MIEALYAHYLKAGAVCTDTRAIVPGSIFFALKGGNFNGNTFAAKALEAGCSLAVVDEADAVVSDQYFLVDNCLEALQELARYHREQLTIPVIGITGSNGKTTTKELIREVLSAKYNTFATKGNLNNHIGVPLSLLSIGPAVEIAIIEMGANHVGEIAFLSSLSQPDYGLITNIGKAHIGEFGSYENIKKGKSELYDFIRKTNGKIFLNTDNAVLNEQAAGISHISYGTSGSCTTTGELLDSDPFLALEWENEKGESGTIETQLVGDYNFENVLAAICIGNHFGVSGNDINRMIEGYTPSNNRSEVRKTARNTLILDAYNANPSSMEAALHNFSKMQGSKKYVVLGHMLELGDDSRAEHQRIIELAGKLGLNEGVLVGREFQKVVQGDWPNFETAEQARGLLASLPLEGYTILIKGSRGIKLESLVDLF